MFVKVKTKSIVSYIVDIMFSKVWNTKITYDITLFMSKRRTNCHMSYFENCVFSLTTKIFSLTRNFFVNSYLNFENKWNFDESFCFYEIFS